MRRILVILILAAGGCSQQGPKSPAGKKPSQQREPRVAVLGGESATAFAKALNDEGAAVTVADSDLLARVQEMAKSDGVIILVDATQGPTALAREDLLLCRQFFPGTVILGLSRTNLIDDGELLELEELELRELMNMYKLPGDSAQICLDSTSAPTDGLKGIPRIASLCRSVKPVDRHPSRAEIEQSPAHLYVLATTATFERGAARPLTTGTYDLLIAETKTKAAIEISKVIKPTEAGNVSIKLSKPIMAQKDESFVVLLNGHVIAAGKLTPSSN